MKHPSMTEKENPLTSEILADDSSEGHEKRLSRYADAKARQQEVVDYILSKKEDFGNILNRESKSLENCGSFLVFRHYYELHKYRLLAGCTCKKHILCALCAIRRAAKCVAVFSEKIKTVTSESEYDLLFITWTVKNGFDLDERYNHCQKSFQKMLQKRKDALKAKPRTDTMFRHVAGAIYSYEVSVGSDGTYHPHVHMIALVKKDSLRFKEMTIKGKSVQVAPDLHAGLVQDWLNITGDSFIIDVRKIQDEKDQISALVETFKYALKFSEMDVKIQIECYLTLKGRKMIGSMGSLRNVKFPDNLNDELLPGEEKYIDLVYQYAGINFGYQMIFHKEEAIQARSLSARYQRKKKRKEPIKDTGLEGIKEAYEERMKMFDASKDGEGFEDEILQQAVINRDVKRRTTCMFFGTQYASIICQGETV